MKTFTFVVALVAALAGQTNAAGPMPANCNVGQQYCGFTLTNNGATHDYWLDQMRKAQPGLDESRRFDALYTCQAGNTLSYDDYCPRTGLACQPPESGKCGSTVNDCCAAK
ncbi:hypothetical protein QBC47DRAFT_364351 [Echria macrotheca]|uniref:Uncharacterized protein n=1 Tax=Echria macrotheca TaxID=438768 RepID=A0AAJ0B433_9PEZI|nr:hypothetical protein QBC47DRAFT_364351 [Echria macrotheca]